MQENTQLQNQLESMMRIGPKGQEFWFAREVMSAFGYSSWRNFRATIERAILSMENCQKNSSKKYVHSFQREVLVGKNRFEKSEDLILSRYACYIIAMNGDPQKEIIASAQAYFAQQVIVAIEQKKILDEKGILAELIDEAVLSRMRKLELTTKEAIIAFELYDAARDGSKIDAKTLLLITEAMNTEEK